MYKIILTIHISPPPPPSSTGTLLSTAVQHAFEGIS